VKHHYPNPLYKKLYLKISPLEIVDHCRYMYMYKLVIDFFYEHFADK